MTYYQEILEKARSDGWSQDDESRSKLEFIASEIFDLTTYDSVMDELLATWMIEVIECIANKKTFEYQKLNYERYILMVNMPFLKDKLSWGTSIRGAWFAIHDRTMEICGTSIIDTAINEFMIDLVNWSRMEDEPKQLSK